MINQQGEFLISNKEKYSRRQPPLRNAAGTCLPWLETVQEAEAELLRAFP
jgi:hypothetical protein